MIRALRGGFNGAITLSLEILCPGPTPNRGIVMPGVGAEGVKCLKGEKGVKGEKGIGCKRRSAMGRSLTRGKASSTGFHVQFDWIKGPASGGRPPRMLSSFQMAGNRVVRERLFKNGL